jgi:hypothetical protein
MLLYDLCMRRLGVDISCHSKQHPHEMYTTRILEFEADLTKGVMLQQLNPKPCAKPVIESNIIKSHN